MAQRHWRDSLNMCQRDRAIRVICRGRTPCAQQCQFTAQSVTAKMHAELGHVSQTAADAVNATKAAGGRVIPVGTTALRLVESAAKDGELHAWDGPTDIFITPGFEFQITDALMTNFHLPKSTLMMLVSALLGPERIKEVYAQAISNEYRFFSYGDASLLMPKGR